MDNKFLQSQEYDMLKNSIDTAIKNHHSKKEQELTTILKTLVDANYITQTQIESLMKDLSQELFNALMREMLSVYTEKDIKNLINAQQTGLNDVQMTELYLRLYEQNKGRELELYAIEVIEGFVEQLVRQFQIAQKAVEDVKGLTEDQAIIVINLIDEGLVEEAEKRLQEFKDGSSDIKSSPKSSGISREDLKMLYQMLKNNYVEDSKKILERLLKKDSEE